MNDQSIFAGILSDAEARTGDESERRKSAEPRPAEMTDFGSFGCLTDAHRPADFLELRLKSGNIGAISYGWIEFIEFDPSVGITIDARGTKYRIKGRNLNLEVREGVRMFEGIVRRRVTWIREADRGVSFESNSTAIVIESIDWQ